MSKPENIEDFYKRKLGWVPDNFGKQSGHFNVFKLDPFVGKNARPVPYVKRDYFKIMLAIGYGEVHYADRIIKAEKQVLAFSNPHIPYKWTNKRISGGYFCIFDDAFIRRFGNINEYAVFHPQGNHVFDLQDEQVETVSKIFKKMFEEINSNYAYKYDVLRNLAFELIHFAMKMQPTAELEKQPVNSAQRIANMFLDLLERQFPIDDNHAKIQFRSASEFAKQLNIHVNHLNRALKEVTQKTTSQIIAERILQEAKILLKHSSWNVSDIAFALGFTEATHFNNFFKKHLSTTPLKFRKA